MASLIPGYEYDVFISYRQKDNKGDRWVSGFVEALKTELESTFKEDISIYFDVNPHDGLLEIHDVEESLKEKLKCAVFIPVISHTYCDIKSFAWENEFKAFIEQASSDSYGLKARLASGNVASRILPVRIHDLDKEDKVLLENELGGVLRAIDFIYKEPGINRPLTPADDDKKNLNKTIYRNQINKTANAIKEILAALMKGKIASGDADSQHWEPVKEVQKGKRSVSHKLYSVNSKLKIVLTVLTLLLILVIFIIYFHPKLFNRSILDIPGISDKRVAVAVMPFINMTNDSTLNIYQDGIPTNLISYLGNFTEDLKVRLYENISGLLQQKNLTNFATLTPSVASNISKILEANLFITGSFIKAGNSIRLNAQIYDCDKKEALNSFQVDGTPDNIIILIDSVSRMVKRSLLISKLRRDEPDAERYPPLPTKSPEAYRLCLMGQKAFSKGDPLSAIDLFKKALEIDTTFYDLYFGISVAYSNAAYSNPDFIKEAKEWCRKGYMRCDKLQYIQAKFEADWLYASFFKTPEECVIYIEQMINLDDQNPGAHYALGDTYSQIQKWDKAIPEFEKSFEINNKWGRKPGLGGYIELGIAYHKTGNFKEEKKLYMNAQKDYPDDDPAITDQYARLAFAEKDTVTANHWIAKFIFKRKEQSWSEAMINAGNAGDAGLADIYSELFPDKAELCYRRALSLESENPKLMIRLASFLIDRDLNIKEGLDLADKALKIAPDNYSYLHCKGWGLYKQGKYKEALEMLQKSWDLRREKAVYNHTAFLHLEAAKKAVAGLN